MTRKKRTFIIVGIVLIGVVGGLVLYLARPPLPTRLTSPANFVIAYPTGAWKIDFDKSTYNKSTNVLQLIVSKEGTQIYLNEQATPEVFNDVPQYYAHLLATMQEYGSVETALGTAHLARPKELAGKQAAVINTQGTLIFANSSQDWTAREWQDFFNNLRTIK